MSVAQRNRPSPPHDTYHNQKFTYACLSFCVGQQILYLQHFHSTTSCGPLLNPWHLVVKIYFLQNKPLHSFFFFFFLQSCYLLCGEKYPSTLEVLQNIQSFHVSFFPNYQIWEEEEQTLGQSEKKFNFLYSVYSKDLFFILIRKTLSHNKAENQWQFSSSVYWLSLTKCFRLMSHFIHHWHVNF